jgi:hypothetical protein
MKVKKLLISMLFILLIGLFSLPAAVLAETRDIYFPTERTATFKNDFGDGRSGGRTHEANDLMGKKMTPLYSAIDGVVHDIEIPEASWGYALTLKDVDGYTYHYIHINNDTPGTDDGKGGVDNAYAPFVGRGSKVRKGQLVGWMGDSGNAENVGSHLHFEIRRPDKTAINPYESLMAALGKPVVASASTYTSPKTTTQNKAKFIFSRNLSAGMTHADVKELQKLLNASGFAVSASGAGSIGKETNYFGPATKAALIKFQKAKKISPASGYFGPLTRTFVNK